MPRSPSFAVILTFFAAFTAKAQSQDTATSTPAAQSQDSAPPAALLDEARKKGVESSQLR